jgi:hypothetical protein
MWNALPNFARAQSTTPRASSVGGGLPSCSVAIVRKKRIGDAAHRLLGAEPGPSARQGQDRPYWLATATPMRTTTSIAEDESPIMRAVRVVAEPALSPHSATSCEMMVCMSIPQVLPNDGSGRANLFASVGQPPSQDARDPSRASRRCYSDLARIVRFLRRGRWYQLFPSVPDMTPNTNGLATRVQPSSPARTSSPKEAISSARGKVPVRDRGCADSSERSHDHAPSQVRCAGACGAYAARPAAGGRTGLLEGHVEEGSTRCLCRPVDGLRSDHRSSPRRLSAWPCSAGRRRQRGHLDVTIRQRRSAWRQL